MCMPLVRQVLEQALAPFTVAGASAPVTVAKSFYVIARRRFTAVPALHVFFHAELTN